MDTTATVPAVAKKEYRNNTAGWLGVVTLDHNGREHGVNIEPLGTMWLSDAEAILTARAPQRPEDNPFLEKLFVVQDSQTGQRSEVQMRPLELVSDRSRDMYASDRYVPGLTDDAEAAALTTRAAKEGTDGPRTPAMVAAEDAVLAAPPLRSGPEVSTQLHPSPPSGGAPVSALADVPQPVPAPPAGGGAAGTPVEPGTESWTQPPEAPGRVLAGSLAGDDRGEPEPETALPTPEQAARQMTPAQRPVTVGAMAGEEEHAQRVDRKVGEETGAARPPAQTAPQGEYAAREEVGSPDAPAANDTEGLIGG